MPRYRFTDTQVRIYVDRALEVAPGDELEWPDGAPDDGQWQPVDGAAGQPQDPDEAQSGKTPSSRRAAKSGA